MDELELLRASLADSLIVSKGEYQYFVHPLSDGVPLVEAAILDEAAAALLEYLWRIETAGDMATLPVNRPEYGVGEVQDRKRAHHEAR